jgi:hypothetical protein
MATRAMAAPCSSCGCVAVGKRGVLLQAAMSRINAAPMAIRKRCPHCLWAKIACGDFRGVEALSEPMRPAKSVVFAGVPILRGDFRGVEALSKPVRPAKSVAFASVPIFRDPRQPALSQASTLLFAA